MLLANYVMAGLQSGSLRVTPFQNGKRPKSRVRFYGSMENVCYSPAFAIQRGLNFSSFGFAAGAGKSVFWYAKSSYLDLGKTYRVRQLYYHRRHPYDAERWTRVIGIFLL